jgi:hypothetical protein
LRDDAHELGDGPGIARDEDFISNAASASGQRWPKSQIVIVFMV